MIFVDFFCHFLFFVSKPCFLSSSTRNHAERFRNYLKKSVLDPRRATLDQNSYFGHVRTYCWLNKLRNNVSPDPMVGHVQTQWGGRRRRRLCVCDYFIFYIINIYGYISYTFLIYSIYAYMFPRYVPCIFPCVFLNLWSQEKISPYSKTTFLLLKFQVLRLLYLY